MQKRKFDPNEPYSVSLSFGPHIVHGHAEESAFGQVMQNMLLREISKTCKESFDAMAATPVGIQPTFECEENDASSILRCVEQWHKLIADQPPVREFEPCSIPDWMRPSLRSQGMTDDQIDKIIITGIEPSVVDMPGVVLRTVSA